MPHPFQIFSQSDYLIQIVDINSHTEWQAVQIQISWLLQKPTDLDLHCLQKQGISGFSRTRVNWDTMSWHCFEVSATHKHGLLNSSSDCAQMNETTSDLFLSVCDKNCLRTGISSIVIDHSPKLVCTDNREKDRN